MEAETQLSVETLHGGQEHDRVQGVEPLVHALVERANRGDACLSRSDIVLDLTVNGLRCLLIRSDHPSAVAILSPREREIARMVATGLTNKTIAQVLDISPWTVSTHLRRIFAKLRVTSRAAMVARLLTSKPQTQEALSNDVLLAIQGVCGDRNRARPGAS